MTEVHNVTLNLNSHFSLSRIFFSRSGESLLKVDKIFW